MHLIAEIYLFDTCSMKCGYCWLAESGWVLDAAQLARFRDPGFIQQIIGFFNSRTTGTTTWTLLLSGGEPLIMPNLGLLCDGLFSRGNQVGIYTSLYLPESHPSFRYLLEHGQPGFDYLMASLHPEAELNGEAFWRKVAMLKDRGHRVFVRFVGQPSRLHRLADISARSRELDVCFYPTALLSDRFPAAYSDDQRAELAGYFASPSQFVQLAGGLDTRGLRCRAGSRVISIQMQTGAITPCTTVSRPVIGNLFEDRLELYPEAIHCPEPGVNCVCDIHFQQDIVPGTRDEVFESLKHGYAPPAAFHARIQQMQAGGMAFYGNPRSGMGAVADDTRAFYTIQETKERFGKLAARKYIPKAGEPVAPLFRPDDGIVCNDSPVTPGNPMLVTTPTEQWAYAVLIPATAAVDAPGVVVRLKVRVISGKLGIGILRPDQSAFIGEESVIRPGEDGCDLFVKKTSGAPWLVLRNVSSDGRPSRAELHSIETFRAVPRFAVA